MISRHLTSSLVAAADSAPVVTLTGPRQSGKTTLVRACFPEHDYLSLEAPDIRSRAREDPRGLLAQAERMILDEIQREPDLLSYIQVLVDEDPRPGRFILTGSQNLLLMESVSQTLAGRTALLRLYPFSLAELHGRPRVDASALPRVRSSDPPDADLWETLWAGFYPRIHDQGLDPREWLADYFRTYVERDLRELMQLSDLRSFETFVRLAAARTGQELNLVGLADDAGIARTTASRWLSALEIGFLAARLPPHHANYRKRLRKRPRLHFLDTGLVCYLLDIPDPGTLARHPLRGAIFESFVVSELIKSFAAIREDARLFFWRDSTGHEIDILLETTDGAKRGVVPIEVKSGETVASDATDTLAWWTAIPDNPNRGGVLVHGGTSCFDLKGFRVLPWFLQ